LISAPVRGFLLNFAFRSTTAKIPRPGSATRCPFCNDAAIIPINAAKISSACFFVIFPASALFLAFFIGVNRQDIVAGILLYFVSIAIAYGGFILKFVLSL
jgi:hypothetical protein